MVTQRSNSLSSRDSAVHLHPYTSVPKLETEGSLVITRGQGVYVYDEDGKAYLEGMSGLWCTSLGYSNEELVEAAREQMSRLPFSHLFSGRSHDPAIELAETLKEIVPIPTSKVFFTSSGFRAQIAREAKFRWTPAFLPYDPEIAATLFISASTSPIFRPRPTCSPTRRLRPSGLTQVVIRSPNPARPVKVASFAPIAMPRRVR